MRWKNRDRFMGSAAVEYTLGASFMLGAVALFLTQSQWMPMLQELQARYLHGDVKEAKSMNVRAMGDISDMSGAVRKVGSQQICFQSGVCVNMPLIPNSGAVADTAGGLGGDLIGAYAKSFLKWLKSFKRRRKSQDD